MCIAFQAHEKKKIGQAVKPSSIGPSSFVKPVVLESDLEAGKKWGSTRRAVVHC